MKKKENQKRNVMLKIHQDSRSRSNSPKPYIGCLTCKLKKVKSNSKLSDCGEVQDKNKLKNHVPEKDELGYKRQNIKLTDLCDEDKKRIVELIEELSNLAEKNQQLKEVLDKIQKERQEQQEYLMKQAKLHLEEKNFYVNEIKEFKSRIETFDNEMRNKIIQWESRERCKDGEIAHLAKALQKTLKDNIQLLKQMDHLKIYLKHSLESFQRLKAEMSEIQRQELIRKHKTVSSQTESNLCPQLTERSTTLDHEETEDEFLSTCNQDSVNAKSSLDIINDELQYVYKILKRKGESLTNTASRNHEIDLSFILKSEKLAKEVDTEGLLLGIQQPRVEDKLPKAETKENNCKFMKPFEQCSKTSVQAERILKKFGKPLKLVISEGTKKLENKTNTKSKNSSRDPVIHSNFLQNTIIQSNTLFKSCEGYQNDEHRLLEELFYPEQIVKLGLGYNSKLEDKEMKKTLYEYSSI